MSDDGGPRDAEMAVFPLGAVLLPGQFLPLQVFENRYKVMLFDLRHDDPAEFVVVLIERGSEVGGGDTRTTCGCVAHVSEVRETHDGRAFVAAIGTRRVRIRDWLEEDPYPRAVVEPAHEGQWPTEPTARDAADALAAEVSRTARAVGGLACRLGAPEWPTDLQLADDPVDRLWQLSLLTPLGTLDRQRLLGIDHPVQRWEALQDMLTDQQALLQARVDWGNS